MIKNIGIWLGVTLLAAAGAWLALYAAGSLAMALFKP